MSKRIRPTLSLVTMVKNEELTLPRCLGSLDGLLDEIVLVDTGSTDETKAVARDACERAASPGAGPPRLKLIDFKWCHDFSAPRNAGLAQAQSDWIIHLDADEELVAGAEELPDLMRDKYRFAYYVRMMAAPDAQSASKGTEFFPAIRLFRRRPELIYRYPIHEQIMLDDEERSAMSNIVINHFGPSLGRTGESKSGRNIPILEKAIAQNPDDGYFHCMLGNEYFLLKRFADAVPFYRSALELEGPGRSWSPPVFRNLGWSLTQERKFAEAQALLAEGQRLYPDYTDLYYVDARRAAASDDLEAAENLFRLCLRYGDPPPHYVSYGGTGSWRARQDLERLAGITGE